MLVTLRRILHQMNFQLILLRPYRNAINHGLLRLFMLHGIRKLRVLQYRQSFQVIHYQSRIRDSSKLRDLCDQPLWLGLMMDLPWSTFNLLQGIYVIYPCESMMDLHWLTFSLLQGIYMNYTFEYMMDLPWSIFNLLQGILCDLPL